LSKNPLPSVKAAFALISSAESPRGLEASNNVQPAAFISKTNESKKFAPKGSLLKCTNCNKTGHAIEKCYELIGYPTNFKGKKPGNKSKSNVYVSDGTSSQAGSFQLTSDQYSRLLSMLSGPL
jgi:hypothetical protein